ncbi:MAG: hypothetical protein AB7Q23_16835 [Hyphomonadaceae bacterium]|nr:hypothetical protein [Hyphomonadaceae bacterium]
MNRRQRRGHARLWPLLALIMLAVIGAGIYAKYRLADAVAAAAEVR